MAIRGSSAAVSHVGKVRSNNQDSGYAGEHLFVVADGMGGHAGGDVASAIAVHRIAEVDREYETAAEALTDLEASLLAANTRLADTVLEHRELTGMGTTVSAIVRVGHHLALAHIGDSRIYLLRRGRLQQVTSDHTFVQRLVDSGRITAEEAAVHPRRNVLMRVLGDVDAAPEIDTLLLETEPGDRWLLCSDGLSSYVTDEKIAAVLGRLDDPNAAANRLVKEALDNGAPDNVTVVLVDVDDTASSAHVPPRMVGSASEPLQFEPAPVKRSLRLPSMLLHPLKPAPVEDSHFEPESEEYLKALILEDKRRRLRRRVSWTLFVLLVIAGIVTAAVLGYQYTQRQFYVGEHQGSVAIFQGVQQDLGPIKLSHLYERTDIELDDLPLFRRTSVEQTINAEDLAHARWIVEQLDDARLR